VRPWCVVVALLLSARAAREVAIACSRPAEDLWCY